MQDYEKLITPGHVAGHRAKAIMASLYVPAAVSYLAGAALAVCAVTGIAGSGITAPGWLDRALTVDSKPYVAAKAKADEVAFAAKMAPVKAAADAAHEQFVSAVPGYGLDGTDLKFLPRLDTIVGDEAASNIDFLTAVTACRTAFTGATLKDVTAAQRFVQCAYDTAHRHNVFPPQPYTIIDQIKADDAKAAAAKAKASTPTPTPAPTAQAPAAPIAPTAPPADVNPIRTQARQALLNAHLTTPETMADAHGVVTEIEKNARILAQGYPDASKALDVCASDFSGHLAVVNSGRDTRAHLPGYVAEVEACERDAALAIKE